MPKPNISSSTVASVDARRHPLDLRCYVVTAAGEPRDIVRVAAEAAKGGAGIIQVRSKPIEARALCELARQVAYAVQATNPHTNVVVDDRVDVALALRTEEVPIHGVHLGQDDLHPTAARGLLGPEAIIGLTTGTVELVQQANELRDVLDYIGCGPYRTTPTKNSGRAPIGSGYPALVEFSELPLVAIGDITLADVPTLAGYGVAGVAMVREVAQSPDPASLCAQVNALFPTEDEVFPGGQR